MKDRVCEAALPAPCTAIGVSRNVRGTTLGSRSAAVRRDRARARPARPSAVDRDGRHRAGLDRSRTAERLDRGRPVLRPQRIPHRPDTGPSRSRKPAPPRAVQSLAAVPEDRACLLRRVARDRLRRVSAVCATTRGFGVAAGISRADAPGLFPIQYQRRVLVAGGRDEVLPAGPARHRADRTDAVPESVAVRSCWELSFSPPRWPGG